MGLTKIRDIYGCVTTCRGFDCWSPAFKEMGGYCEVCWWQLPDEKRPRVGPDGPRYLSVDFATLGPARVVVEDRQPRRSRVAVPLLILWRVAMTVAVAWLAWKLWA